MRRKRADRLDEITRALEPVYGHEGTRQNVAAGLVGLGREDAEKLFVAMGVEEVQPTADNQAQIASILTGDWAMENREPTFPPPLSVGEILAKPEPEAPWLAEGIIPAHGNVLLVGYPKSFKTFVHMELAVAVATGTPFLGKYATPGGLKVGLVLLEGGEREQARRLDRIAQARGLRGEHLDDLIHVWHRPPLRFTDTLAMYDLGRYA